MPKRRTRTKPKPVEVDARGFPLKPTNREVRSILKYVKATAAFYHAEAERLRVKDTVRGFTPESREATGKFAALMQIVEDIEKNEHLGKAWKEDDDG